VIRPHDDEDLEVKLRDRGAFIAWSFQSPSLTVTFFQLADGATKVQVSEKQRELFKADLEGTVHFPGNELDSLLAGVAFKRGYKLEPLEDLTRGVAAGDPDAGERDAIPSRPLSPATSSHGELVAELERRDHLPLLGELVDRLKDVVTTEIALERKAIAAELERYRLAIADGKSSHPFDELVAALARGER